MTIMAEIFKEYILPWGFFILMVVVISWLLPRSGGG
jgi:hypothetical protein